MLRLFSRHGLAKSRVYIRMHEGESGIIFGCTRLDLIPNTREPRKLSERSPRNRKLLIQGLNFELAAPTGTSFCLSLRFPSFRVATNRDLERSPGIRRIRVRYSPNTLVFVLIHARYMHEAGAFDDRMDVKRQSILRKYETFESREGRSAASGKISNRRNRFVTLIHERTLFRLRASE